MNIASGIRELKVDEIDMVTGAGFAERLCRSMCWTIQMINGNLGTDSVQACVQICS